MMKLIKVNKSQLLPFALLLFAAVTFSLTFSLNRVALTEGIPVFAFVFWQCLESLGSLESLESLESLDVDGGPG